MTTASHIRDDGWRCPNKCFPARTVLHRRKEGAAHWLVAYRRTEEQKYRNMQYARIKETYRKCKNKTVETPRGVTLDGPFLLQLHRVDKPSELCFADISEQKLNSNKPEDLKLFNNVVYVDASVNALSLESFCSFVSLRELNLSLNGLCNLIFHVGDFPHLQVLDLSYNSLSAGDIVSIGQLPRLKVLHLTGNQLYHLITKHETTHMSAGGEDPQFKALEVLELDDNRLSSAVFNSLENLQRLKYLNLQGNRISKVPYLQLMGTSKPSQTSNEEEGLASTEANTDEHVKRVSQVSHEENCEESCKGSRVPLPELQFLNLADNKIAEEEALMAVALFPMLREVDICSNPLTTQRSGDPPLLTHYLQERLGIAIKRKRTQGVVRVPLRVSTDPEWKVEERVPKKSGARWPAQAEKQQLTDRKTPESEDQTLQENTDRVFLTQATDVPEFDLQADQEDSAENKGRRKKDARPVKFACYEILMEAKPNPDVLEPTGIQRAVHMLEHTLRNPNVYRYSKPKRDCIQTPHRDRKTIKELPPLKPIKQPAERIDGLIKEFKESSSITQVPLNSAMHSTGKQEALLLLRDMKTKYKRVHKKTLEQAARIQSGPNTNQTRGETPPVQIL